MEGRNGSSIRRDFIAAARAALEEPAVREAVERVAQAEGVSPKLVEGLLAPFTHSTFRGRDTAYWTRMLADELRFGAERQQRIAREHELACARLHDAPTDEARAAARAEVLRLEALMTG